MLREPAEGVGEQREGQHEERHREPDLGRRELVDARQEEGEGGGVEADGEAVGEREGERREQEPVRADRRRDLAETGSTLRAPDLAQEQRPRHRGHGDEGGADAEREQGILGADDAAEGRPQRDAEGDATADESHHATALFRVACVAGQPEQQGQRDDVSAALEEAKRQEDGEAHVQGEGEEEQRVDAEGSDDQGDAAAEAIGESAGDGCGEEGADHVDRHEHRREELRDGEAFLDEAPQDGDREGDRHQHEHRDEREREDPRTGIGRRSRGRGRNAFGHARRASGPRSIGNGNGMFRAPWMSSSTPS